MSASHLPQDDSISLRDMEAGGSTLESGSSGFSTSEPPPPNLQHQTAPNFPKARLYWFIGTAANIVPALAGLHLFDLQLTMLCLN